MCPLSGKGHNYDKGIDVHIGTYVLLCMHNNNLYTMRIKDVVYELYKAYMSDWFKY